MNELDSTTTVAIINNEATLHQWLDSQIDLWPQKGPEKDLKQILISNIQKSFYRPTPMQIPL